MQEISTQDLPEPQEFTLEEFVNKHSQDKAAEIIRCSQSAVSQMIRKKRIIFIIENPDGTFDSREIKRPNSHRAA